MAKTADPIDGPIDPIQASHERERAAYEAGLQAGLREGQRRAAFEASLSVKQRVYLRYAWIENNSPSGETWYAPPGTRAVIDMIEPHPNGPLYNVAFIGRRTVNGEEKRQRICRPLSASVLCAYPKEAK